MTSSAPRGPDAKTTDRSDAPERQQLLFNAAKFRQAASDPTILLPSPPGRHITRIGAFDVRNSPRVNRAKSPQHDSLVKITTFGTAPRDYTPGGLDGFGVRAIPAVATSASIAPAPGEYDVTPRSFQTNGITIPTSPRFKSREEQRPRSARSSQDHGETGVPGPGSYDVKTDVVRPRTARTVLRGGPQRAHDIMFSHGMALHLASGRGATVVPAPGAYSPATAAPPAGPVTIPKSNRPPVTTRQAAAVPGPGAYTPHTPGDRAAPRTVFAKDERSVPVLKSVNSLFLTTERHLSAVPGVGSYNPYASSVVRPVGAATFAKTPRDHVRSVSPPAATPPSAALEDGGVEAAPHPTSIEAMTRRRPGFTFGKQDRDQRFVAVGSRMLLQTSRDAADSAPGVGAYTADRHGTIASDAADALRRSPKRRADRETATTHDAASMDATASSTKKWRTPGPGAYDGAAASTFHVSADTHNQWLRASVDARRRLREATVGRSPSKRRNDDAS